MKRLVLIAMVVLLSSPIAIAQDFCEGDFDYDGDQDGTDASLFKSDFGRSEFSDPCPPDGPAPVPRTGQITQYAPGDDGELQKGVPWPNPRFTDNGNETVTDNLTGLMWLKDANCIATNYPEFDQDSENGDIGDGKVHWQHALDFVAGINDGTYINCGGVPPYNDWRLPNRFEYESLCDLHYHFPSVPDTSGSGQWSEGDPFNSLPEPHAPFNIYCTSSTFALDFSKAWFVVFSNCNAGPYTKFIEGHVWPVRGGP